MTESELPYGATITPNPVSEYNHLKEPLRSDWIACMVCKQVPPEIVYDVHVPPQVQGDKKSHGIGTSCCSVECARKWLANLTLTYHSQEEREGSAMLPSQEAKRGWIHCFRKSGSYPDDTVRSGKWLIWLRPENIDRYWVLIKQAVEEGRLGSEAKVSTAGSLSEKRPRHVICVYTYDYEDKDDVMRIREELRRLGIRREIIYKADQDTGMLKYGRDYEPKYRA